MIYVTLILAVIAETIGTSALYASKQFTRPLPAALTVLSYAVSFYLLSLTLKTLPVGIMYAMWSGLGIVLIALIGYVVYGQKLDWPAVLGIGLILAGLIVINLFSSTARH